MKYANSRSRSVGWHAFAALPNVENYRILQGRESMAPTHSSHRQGVVLLAVLVVVAILTLVSYGFFNLMTAEHEAVHASNRQAQLRMLADSGLHHAAFVLSNPHTAGLSDGDNLTVSPSAIYDNPAFQGIPVKVANARQQGFFSIVAPRDGDDQGAQGYRFGVQDESGKLNVNTLQRLDSGKNARAMLLKLPGMTEETADAILNWTKSSSKNSESSNADSMFYSALGYSLKNGPFESQEELLLIRGITPRLLLGNDLNRNGLLEPDEDDNNGARDPGLGQFLTIYSRELNIDSQGQPRINVNDSDLEGLYTKLNDAMGEELATFIVAYRMFGPASSSTKSGGGTGAGGGTGSGGGLSRSSLNFGRGGSGGGGGRSMPKPRSLKSIYELVDAKVGIQQEGSKESTIYPSPLQMEDLGALREDLPILLDMLTTSSESELPARINVNTAPPEVLMTLPDLTEADVEVILDHQPGPGMDSSQANIYRTPAWLLTETGFKPDLLRKIEPYITTRSQVFRVQVLGYYDPNGPNSRLEAVIDTNRQRPRFLYWRDLTELGR